MLGQFPPMVVATDLRDPTRDVVVESKDKVACGACGRRLRRPRCCGKRAFCTASVDAEGIARVFHSTGRVHRPARARRERRGCRGRARCSVLGAMSLPVACSCRLLSRINLKQRRDETETETTNKNRRRKDEGRRTEQTITSQQRISACRSPVPPTDRGRCRLAGIPLEALSPNIVIVVATQENVARPLPGEGTHDVAGVRLWWKRTGVEHWIGVVPSQAVETEGGGTCRRQGTR